jgi:hypothetical protein
MSSDERKKIIGRRRFLKGYVTLGVTALARRLLGGGPVSVEAAGAEVAPQPPVVASTVAPADLDHHVYVPCASGQRPVAHGPAKLGVHTLRPNNAVGFVQDVHDAGACVALVKALDNFGYLRLVKEISPETVTVARWNGVQSVDPDGDPAYKADQVLGQHMPHWQYEKDVVDYWEVLNENDPSTVEGHVWLAHFFIEAMNIAEEDDYKLALFSYSVGVPKWHEWEAIVETGVFVRAQEGGHVLALHEYNWPVMDYRWGEPLEDQPAYEDRGVLTGRYRHLYRDFLIPRSEVVPLAITECGLDPVLWQPGQPTNHWQERYVEEMVWYDTRLREDDYAIGAAMFTIGGAWGWETYDYEELLPDFHDYIVSLKGA